MDVQVGLAWPVDRLADAVEALARATGLIAPATRSRRLSHDMSPDGIGIGGNEFETESGDVAYGDVERTLGTSGPALLKLTVDGGESFLALIGSSGRGVRLLAPSGQRVRVPIASVAAWLRNHADTPLKWQIDGLLEDAKVPPARRSAARAALLSARLESTTVTRCWMLRPAPSASLWQHMRHACLTRRLAVFSIAYAGASLASIGSWWLIGGAALEGRFDPGTLLAWSFLLLSLVPLSLFAMWSQGVFILGTGGLLKLQLLAGALKLDLDDSRRHGIGGHLARVVESESVEALALTGGFYALAGLLDLALAAAIFLAVGDYLPLLLFLLSLAVNVAMGGIYFRRRERWTAARLQLTDDMIERMAGHRTRLVQESPARAHDEQDDLLERYVAVSRPMDRAAVLLSATPRAWLLIGMAALAPQFVRAEADPAILGAGIGATLLAFSALGKMHSSVGAFVDAIIGWRQLEPLLRALRTSEPLGHIDTTVAPIRARGPRSSPLLTAQDVGYRYADRAEPVLRGCSFKITTGDCIHLSGASGGGKSTLVSLLTGLRVQDSGLLLLDGLDRATLGVRGWRRRIAAAPQFHENHLFNDTLAFNLLLARRWPPTDEDLRWADTVCRRLGLGEVVDRMPAGLFQVVGDTGWQLSHGERSRVFMARALLQGADLVMLDESFAELDPESLQRCLPEAARLANSLLVVAHT